MRYESENRSLVYIVLESYTVYGVELEYMNTNAEKRKYCNVRVTVVV